MGVRSLPAEEAVHPEEMEAEFAVGEASPPAPPVGRVAGEDGTVDGAAEGRHC